MFFLNPKKLGGGSRGFSLIELLVVISIIGFLSSVVLASLQTAREKARGTAFRQSVDQLVLAIELYRSDHNDELPLVQVENQYEYRIDYLGGRWCQDFEYDGCASIGQQPISKEDDLVEQALAPYLAEISIPPFDFRLNIRAPDNDSGETFNFVIMVEGPDSEKVGDFFGDWDGDSNNRSKNY